ncbi:hypothetical protein PLICRDRAFT_142944 [Plicaturopsis crispa FD-325 SS-3]|nr:hypothetical protein PLICRDRAFT_142944 [Plicaturopsis crispa FD-325 SS-3]
MRGLCLLLYALYAAGIAGAEPKKPNIILIITDDQDVSTVNPSIMPRLHEHMIGRGTSFKHFFTPVSVCCPSRVSLLRAQHAHNHNITYVQRPWGGWEKFCEFDYNGHYLPNFLQKAGYGAYYIGKLMNGNTVANAEKLPASGWDDSDFLLDPFTYDYNFPAFSRNGRAADFHENVYSTDLVANKSLALLDNMPSDKPFFIGIAPIGPHSHMAAPSPGTNDSAGRRYMDIPIAHPRHRDLFSTASLNRSSPSFNPDVPSGASWVRTLEKLRPENLDYLDEFYRGRLRALQAVDELVEAVVKRLETNGLLEDTYIIYTSDNGFALGSHRRQPGKTLPFEEDISVPFVVRGPGVAENVVNSADTYNMVDLGTTILELAGAAADYLTDGSVMNFHGPAQPVSSSRHALVEYWVYGVEEGIYSAGLRENNTYRAVRFHNEDETGQSSYLYSVWCTGERELYDLVEDPHQMNNLLGRLNDMGPFTAFSQLSRDDDNLHRLSTRLDALLLVLKTCQDAACTAPFASLFPDGEVFDFAGALQPGYDEYFASLPRVRYSSCELGYQTRFEEPRWRDAWAYRTSEWKDADETQQCIISGRPPANVFDDLPQWNAGPMSV